MEWVYFSMAGLWAVGCAMMSSLGCIGICRRKGWRFLIAILPLLIPITFLCGAVPILALREAYSQTTETLRADEWTCTDGHFETGYTMAANTSQRTERYVCSRYERMR